MPNSEQAYRDILARLNELVLEFSVADGSNLCGLSMIKFEYITRLIDAVYTDVG